MLRPTVLAFLLVSAPAPALPQDTACTVAVTVATQRFLHPLRRFGAQAGSAYAGSLWVPAPGLEARDFAASEGRYAVRVLSATPDTAPRRIALLLAYGRGPNVAPETRLSGTDLPPVQLNAILYSARPGDSLGLLNAWGPRLALRLGSRREAIRDALETLPLGSGRPQGDAVLDALREVAGWFSAPAPGDCIILVGGSEHWPRAETSQVRSVLVSRGIRLFVLGAGISEGESEAGLPLESLSPDGALAEATGGGWESIWDNGPAAADENPRLWWKEAAALYDIATSGYVLRLESTGPHLRIELARTALGRLNPTRVSYPRPLPVCP